MGYFTILAAVPGFFLSSLIFMLLWGVIAPELRDRKDRLSYGYADNHYSLAGGSTTGGGGRPKSQEVARPFFVEVSFTMGGKAD